MFRHRTVARHLLYALDFSGELDCVLMPILLFGQLCLGFLPTRVFTTFYVAKVRRTVNATSTDILAVSLFRDIPTGSLPQFSILKNWVFQTEYHGISCLHSLCCSPSSKRCKKLIPDGIQPIKKTAHEGQAKSKKVSPSGSSQ